MTKQYIKLLDFLQIEVYSLSMQLFGSLSAAGKALGHNSNFIPEAIKKSGVDRLFSIYIQLKIKEALKSGKEVKGAGLKRNHNLQIKG